MATTSIAERAAPSASLASSNVFAQLPETEVLVPNSSDTSFTARELVMIESIGATVAEKQVRNACRVREWYGTTHACAVPEQRRRNASQGGD
jgi:hypothetical protein